MQAMKAEKINVDRVSLARLMVDMKEGRIRVPRFQRGFVWERGRIQELLDSIYKEYPIGTIFLWEAPPEYNHLLLRTVDYLQQPPIASDKSYSVILDGQQRLTSLYVVVHGLVVLNPQNWTLFGRFFVLNPQNWTLFGRFLVHDLSHGLLEEPLLLEFRRGEVAQR